MDNMNTQDVSEEVEIEILDEGGQDDTNSGEVIIDDASARDSESYDESEDDNSPTNSKNKSNWKKVSNKAKKADALERRVEELEGLLIEKGDIVNDSENDTVTPAVSSEDKILFFVQNKEALSYKPKIDEAMSKYNGIDVIDAWNLVKSTIPETSNSRSEFSFDAKPKTVTKKISELTEDEAMSLRETNYPAYSKWLDQKFEGKGRKIRSN